MFSALMRRLIASLVLCLLAWGPLSPLAITAAGDPVPECCRRDGKHHCMMAGMGATEEGSTSLRTSTDPCPYRSQRATPVATLQLHRPTVLVQHMPMATRLAMPVFVVRGSRRLALIPQRGPPENPIPANS